MNQFVMKQFNERRRARLFGFAGFLLSLLACIPYFQEYLQVPNRELLPWDMALHAKDGMTLLIQLKRLDLISLLWSFVNMSFWMPLHPVLIALFSVVAPYRVEAYVLLNLLALSAGVGWTFYLMARAGRFHLAQKIAYCTGLLVFLFRIGNSPHFWVTHYNVMIESLGLGLTLVFVTAALLDGTERGNSLYRRTGVISLSLLLFTKIQYGMFFGAAYVAHALWRDRLELLGPGGHFPRLWQALKRNRILLMLCGLLFVSGIGLIVSRQNVGDGIACAVFSVVLAISFLPSSRREAPPFFQDFYRYLLIPFGWFYFFPVKNKVRHLLYNASTASGESLSEKLTVLIRDLSEHFLRVPLAFGWLLLAVLALMSFAIWRFRARTDRIRPALAWGLILAFYLPMSLAAAARMSRLSLTWVAVIAVVFLLQLISLVHRRALLIALSIGFAGLAAREVAVQPRAEMRRVMTETGYLDPSAKNLGAVLERLDFTKAGVVYGLGATMDQATVIFDWKALPHHPEYTSVFSKREERNFVANDFGRSGNEHPSEEILRRAQKSDLHQIVLYRSGFEPAVWDALRGQLGALGFQPVIDTAETVFFAR